MSKVYYASARVRKWDYDSSLPGKLEALIKQSGLMDNINKDDSVAIKTHFGSHGCHRVIRPIFIKKVVKAVKATGASPFVTDTVRIMGLEYLEVANDNGINHLSVGAPVLIADGIYGKDNILVNAEGLGEIAIASAIHDAPAMIVLSHVKGHINSGYAGAIKNMAMGGVSGGHRKRGWKCGRGAMHARGHGTLSWIKDKCEMCMQCQEVCPLDCISFSNTGEFAVDDAKCWRCARCVRVCPTDAIEFEGASMDDFMRSLPMAARAVKETFEPGKIIYINFIFEVQPECDCMPGADVPIVQDQGILISDDMIAIEQASADILKRAHPLPDSAATDRGIKPGEDVIKEVNQRDYELQFDEGEKIGIGSRTYELIELKEKSSGPDLIMPGGISTKR